MKTYHTFYHLSTARSAVNSCHLFVGRLLAMSLLFSTVLIQPLSAQDVTLNSQAEINAFDQSVVNGNLRIFGDETVTDLSPLDVLTEVTGSLGIFSTNVTNLKGLANLVAVGRGIDIEDNAKLVSLQGLENITELNNLFIAFNNRLTNLQGLEGLVRVEGGLILLENTALNNLEGLNNLTSTGNLAIDNGFASNLESLRALKNLTTINGYLVINSTGISTLEGLDNLTFIGGSLDIERNKQLTSLKALSKLSFVGGSLDIELNSQLSDLQGLEGLTSLGSENDRPFGLLIRSTSLVNLQGLDNVTSIKGDVFIEDNTSLTTLQGLDSLTTIEGALRVTDNPRLSNCCAIQLAASLVTSFVNIDGNAPGCDSPSDLVNCSDLSPVINSFTLVNNANDRDLRQLEDGEVIKLNDFNLEAFTVRANAFPAGKRIRRVEFNLTAPAGLSTIRSEYAEPYALFTDDKGDYFGKKAYIGDYRLTATPYYVNSDGKEIAGTSKTINFTFASDLPPTINRFMLVNNNTDEDIQFLEDGDMIKLRDLGSETFNIRAIAFSAGKRIRRVEFQLDAPAGGDVVRSEYAGPYALFSDDDGDYFGRKAYSGNYRLTATPYYLNDAGAEIKGISKTIHFTFTGQNTQNSLTESAAVAYPVPFDETLSLRIGAVDISKTCIQLVHGYGQVYEVQPNQISTTEAGLQISLSTLPSGPYTVRVLQGEKLSTFRVSKQ